jgi:hypothetical protein
LPLSPDSPDVTPSDFYLFRMVKEKLKKCAARMLHDLKREADSILSRIPKAELISVFQMWLRR